MKPSVRHLPVSYIKAFAYQPVAFPAPLAPITTYQVSKGMNQNQPNNLYSRSNLIQQFLQQQQQSRHGNSIYSVNGLGDYASSTAAPITTTTPVPVTTTTTTQAPQPQERQWFGNYAGYSSVAQTQFPNYNQNGNYLNPNPQSYLSNRQSAFQYYTVDPSSYQFIPTNVNHNGALQFVPCMCPIGVNVINPGSSPADRTSSPNQPTPQPMPTQVPQTQEIPQIQVQYATASQTQPSVSSQYVVQPDSNLSNQLPVSSVAQPPSNQLNSEEGI